MIIQFSPALSTRFVSPAFGKNKVGVDKESLDYNSSQYAGGLLGKLTDGTPFHSYSRGGMYRVELGQEPKLISASPHSYPREIEEIDFTAGTQKQFKPGKTLRYSLNQIFRALTYDQFPLDTSLGVKTTSPLGKIRDILAKPFKCPYDLLADTAVLPTTGAPFRLLRTHPNTFRLLIALKSTPMTTTWHETEIEVDPKTCQIIDTVSRRSVVDTEGEPTDLPSTRTRQPQGELPSRKVHKKQRRIRPSREPNYGELSQAPVGKRKLLRLMAKLLGIKRLPKLERAVLPPKPKFVPINPTSN